MRQLGLRGAVQLKRTTIADPAAARPADLVTVDRGLAGVELAAQQAGARSGPTISTHPPAAIGVELDRVERDLLLRLVEDHEARAMIQPVNRVGREAQALVRIVERHVHRRPVGGRRQGIPDQRGLSGVAGSRQDPDGPAPKTHAEDLEQPSGMERHVPDLSGSLQDLKENLH